MAQKRKVVHGSQGMPREFSGNRKRLPFDAGVPKLEFGDFGELTPKTIRQANLTREETDRAFEVMRVQTAFLEILDAMSYPVDPEGHVHDLSAIGPTKNAIAWTLALNGFRPTGPKYIKKRSFAAGGCYTDAHTWVDVRQPDTAAEELRPEHHSADFNLPPDTRKLAADRDKAPMPQMPDGWHAVPKVTAQFEPRPVAPTGQDGQ